MGHNDLRQVALFIRGRVYLGTLLISLPVWLKLTGFDSSVPYFSSDALSIGSGHDESVEVGEAAQRQPLCENSGVLVPTWMVTLSDLRQSFKGRSKVSFILHRGPLSILASSHPLSASCGVPPHPVGHRRGRSASVWFPMRSAA